MCAQILVEKISPHEPEGRGTDNDCIRRRESLNAGSDVGGVTQGELFLATPTAHFAYNHHSGVNADADRQAHVIALRQTGIECSQRLHHVKASSHGPSGVVFMRLRVTKIYQQTIPKVLRNMAIKAPDDYRISSTLRSLR
jgi:hypothetical protein